MARPKSRRLRQGGWTLMEMLLAVIIFLIVTPAVVTFFFQVTQGFSADEARALLKKTQQESFANLFQKVAANKRIFGGADAVSMLYYMDMTGCPATLAGSQFPAILPLGSLNLTSPSYDPASVGNCLLMLVSDSNIYCKGVTNTSGNSVTIQLNTYRLYYYYLSPTNPKYLKGPGANVVTPLLYEWRSVPLVDYNQLNPFVIGGDNTLRNNLLNQLINPPAPANALTPTPNPVTLAVDTSDSVTVAPVSILYTVGASSLTRNGTAAILKPDPFGNGPLAQRSKVFQVTHMTTGIMGKSFKYGVYPNNNAQNFANGKVQVPLYAPGTSVAPFPSGFEVVVAGPAVGRQVLIRSVLAAQGYFPNLITDEQVQVMNCRDIW